MDLIFLGMIFMTSIFLGLFRCAVVVITKYFATFCNYKQLTSIGEGI